MIWPKFFINALLCECFLLLIVCLGTFDLSMAFSWYSFLITGLLSAFYGFTKGMNTNALPPEEGKNK